MIKELPLSAFVIMASLFVLISLFWFRGVWYSGDLGYSGVFLYGPPLVFCNIRGLQQVIEF